MKKIYIKLLSVLILPLFIVGCIEEAFPEGATQVEAQIKQSEFAQAGLMSAFPVAMTSVNQLGFFSAEGIHSDFGLPAIHLMMDSMHQDIAIMGDNPGYWWFNRFSRNHQMDDQQIYPAYLWQHYYAYIKIANDVIQNIPEADNMPELSKASLGQAFAYRAKYYLDLARMYEPKENDYTDVSKILGLTVPIVTEKTTGDELENNPRVPREEMYEFIISDLTKAVKYLANAPTDYTVPTLSAAYGLLARTYLEMGYWKETGDIDAFKNAVKYADLAITTSGKTPLTRAEWQDPVNGFNNGAANNSWIWGIPVSSENVGNIIAFIPHISVEAIYGYGPYSFPSIDAQLYSQIQNGDFRKYSWMDPDNTKWTGEGSPYKYAGTPADQQKFLGRARPYTTIKFRPAQGDCNTFVVGNEADIVLMRVEEMYFIKMEALAHYDLNAAVTTLKNFMATRMTDGKTYAAPTIINKGSIIDEIFLQKRIEFWAEGIMVFDYKRLDKGFNRRYEGTNHPVVWQFKTNRRSPQWNIVITRTELQGNSGITAETNNPDPTGLLKNTD